MNSRSYDERNNNINVLVVQQLAGKCGGPWHAYIHATGTYTVSILGVRSEIRCHRFILRVGDTGSTCNCGPTVAGEEGNRPCVQQNCTSREIPSSACERGHVKRIETNCLLKESDGSYCILETNGCLSVPWLSIYRFRVFVLPVTSRDLPSSSMKTAFSKSYYPISSHHASPATRSSNSNSTVELTPISP